MKNIEYKSNNSLLLIASLFTAFLITLTIITKSDITIPLLVIVIIDIFCGFWHIILNESGKEKLEHKDEFK